MDKGNAPSFSTADRALLDQTATAALAGLDSDKLDALHARVRRARDKYVGQYRRGGAGKVSSSGGRGKAFTGNQVARDKAAEFELALARVSQAMATQAKRDAAALKAERLESGRTQNPKPAKPTKTTAKRAAAPARPATAPAKGPAKTSGSKRPASSQATRNAASRSTGARRQAKRDGR